MMPINVAAVGGRVGDGRGGEGIRSGVGAMDSFTIRCHNQSSSARPWMNLSTSASVQRSCGGSLEKMRSNTSAGRDSRSI